MDRLVSQDASDSTPFTSTIIKSALYIVWSKVKHLYDNNQILDIQTVHGHNSCAVELYESIEVNKINVVELYEYI